MTVTFFAAARSRAARRSPRSISPAVDAVTDKGMPWYLRLTPSVGVAILAPEVRAVYLASESRISSAVLIQVNGLGFWSQFSIQSQRSASRAWTLPCAPRRILWSARHPSQGSTWLIEEEPVEARCRRTRGWQASQSWRAAVL